MQQRRLAAAKPDTQAEIRRVLARVSNEVANASSRDFSAAERAIETMSKQGQLNEAALVGFAKGNQYEEMVAGLARICAAPVELIEKLMQNPRYDGVLVACKAAVFRWPTLNAILKARFAPYEMPPNDLIQVRADFIKLSVATARRMFRFWMVRGVAKVES